MESGVAVKRSSTMCRLESLSLAGSPLSCRPRLGLVGFVRFPLFLSLYSPEFSVTVLPPARLIVVRQAVLCARESKSQNSVVAALQLASTGVGALRPWSARGQRIESVRNRRQGDVWIPAVSARRHWRDRRNLGLVARAPGSLLLPGRDAPGARRGACVVWPALRVASSWRLSSIRGGEVSCMEMEMEMG